MLTKEQKQSFHRNGFLVVPNLLTAREIAWLRSFFEPLFKRPSKKRLPGDTDGWLVDIYNRYPECQWLLFHEPTTAALRSLLGEGFVFLRDHSALHEFYSSWHKDSGGIDLAGQSFHREPDFLMVQTALYLQDNSYLLGGGLDVEPGTHTSPEDPFVLKKPYQVTNALTVPSRAGDFVIFDFRLNHRATPRLLTTDGTSDKMGIFQPCSTNSPHVHAYYDYLKGRPAYDYLWVSDQMDALVATAKDRGLTLA